ncbi:NADH dehydrogenase subunit 2 (mitochondrion) [Australozyma saopauloensis]|uniref:NADH-ubiquinone oxidoreductase chain 2 n=1 Tax=Australozyma saopauloensis TaxID=291208 RepID=A0AAX4HH65_9ASCO|nr:NADH dehydrogenase subunit 2 [[Candida] saopauloensis]
MLFTSILIFLVLSTYICHNDNSFNRLGTITVAFITLMFISSLNIVSISNGITLFNNWFIFKTINLPIIFMMLLFIMSWLTYSSTNSISINFNLLVLVLTNLLGLMTLPLVNDLLMLYIIIELQSYTLYLMTGLYNKSYNSTRASMLYFMTGGMASTIMLMSMYFLFNEYGTMNLNEMNMLQNYNNTFNMTEMMLMMGLMFKMGMAPLHRWSMSVYNYAPTYMTAYMSIVAKLSMSSLMFANYWLFDNYVMLLFMYMSLLMGAYKPLYQMNLKTMLAYSGMLNFGYLLLSVMSYDMSYYMYMMQYVLTHLLMFMMLLSAGELVTPVSKWSPLLFMNQLNMNNNYLLMSLMMCMFSLMGMPPTPGFFSKLFIMESSLMDNYMFEMMLLMMCSVMATYYYANMMKMSMNSMTNKEQTVYMNSTVAYMMSVTTMLLLTFYIYLPNMIEGLMMMYM